MKTGRVQDPGDGTPPYLETHGWTPWQYHAREEDIGAYHTAADAMMTRLERMPPAVRSRLKTLDIRCPDKGCLLVSLYKMARRPTADEVEHQVRLDALDLRDRDGAEIRPRKREWCDYLYVGRTPAGTEVYDMLYYGFAPTPKDEARGCTCCRVVYWRSGCRHGTASIDRHAIYDMRDVAERWRSKPEEQVIAKLPDYLRPHWGKRVFHPPPGSWHPKHHAVPPV